MPLSLSHHAPLRALSIPEGTDILLSGRHHTTRKPVTFHRDHVVATNEEYATIELTVDGHIWTLIVPLKAIEVAPTPAPEQLSLPVFEARDALDLAARARLDAEALEALRASAPAHRLSAAPHRVSVPSDAEAARTYTVEMVEPDKALGCSCHDHTFRRRRCKHMRRAELIDLWDEAVEALLERGTSPQEILRTWRAQVNDLGVEVAMLRTIAAAQVGGLRMAEGA